MMLWHYIISLFSARSTVNNSNEDSAQLVDDEAVASSSLLPLAKAYLSAGDGLCINRPYT